MSKEETDRISEEILKLKATANESYQSQNLIAALNTYVECIIINNIFII